MTGGYWDQFLLAPVIHGSPIRNLAMVGYAGGTVGRAYGQVWPDVNVLGIELDGDVTAAGRRYLGLDDNPRVRVATDDGRVYLEAHTLRLRRDLPGRVPPALHPLLPDDPGVLVARPRPPEHRRRGDGQRRPRPR